MIKKLLILLEEDEYNRLMKLKGSLTWKALLITPLLKRTRKNPEAKTP